MRIIRQDSWPGGLKDEIRIMSRLLKSGTVQASRFYRRISVRAPLIRNIGSLWAPGLRKIASRCAVTQAQLSPSPR
jgi:hypothetical protein